MNYQVVFTNLIGGGILKSFRQEFSSPEEAEQALDLIANYTLFLHENALMPDYSNMGIVLKREGDEWVEIDTD